MDDIKDTWVHLEFMSIRTHTVHSIIEDTVIDCTVMDIYYGDDKITFGYN